TSRGLGKRLYACLMELLKLQGVRTATSSVTAGNPKSDALHRSFGFEIFGIHRNAGYKCGGWHDIIHYARQIAPYDNNPALFIPFCDVPAQQAAEILERFNQTDE
ncbi:MAG: GNAT family N-acetyltransferase, partial [Desulfovibrionaceae bacterium]|nr:GNAT family N-acetyltransferase [Desulfovibrionaceae bacterium]